MNTENAYLVELWREGLELKNAGKWESAAAVFEEILGIQPDWEQGYGYFNLAESYEEKGKLDDARTAYERAVECTPSDRTLLGGLASFLFLHGQPDDAFREHLRLILLELARNDTEGARSTRLALDALGSRLGMSRNDVEELIDRSLREQSG